MSDLISRAALFNSLATAQDKSDIFAAIQAAPAVDAVSVVEYTPKNYLRKMAMFEQRYTMETDKDKETLFRFIEDAPAVDAVVHGHWMTDISTDGWMNNTCSECGCEFKTEADKHKLDWKYCPNCGAQMKEVNH